VTIPVTVVAGFLGSGKTTLLRRAFLAGRPGTAVIVNEFGAVGIDHRLLYSTEQETVLVGGGCACCAKRPDLARALASLLDAPERPERVVIELSGLADPAPVAFTLAHDPLLRHHYALESIVVTVDGELGFAQLREQEQSRRQALVADELIATKADRAGEPAIAALAAELHALNPAAAIHAAVDGAVRPQALYPGGAGAPAERGPGAGHAQADATALTVAEPLDWVGFTVWLSLLLHAHGEDVLRVKGVLDLGADGRVLLDAVQHVMSPPRHLGPDVAAGTSEVVFITRNLDTAALERSAAAFQLAARAA
jgi:G3E family GTPase